MSLSSRQKRRLCLQALGLLLGSLAGLGFALRGSGDLLWAGPGPGDALLGAALVPILLGAFVGVVMAMGLDLLLAGKSDKRLRLLFEGRVAAGVLDRLLSDPRAGELEGQRKELTLLCVDLQGYSALSLAVPPRGVLGLLREFHAAMIAVLFRHGGTVDRVLGDGLLAFFNEPLDQPDHALCAVRCALEMQEEINRLQKTWIAAGKTGLQVRIGIATGEAYLGQVGAACLRQYTAAGPAVHLAAALQRRAPTAGILVSGATYQVVKEAIDCQEIEQGEPKGPGAPGKAYWVFGLHGAGSASGTSEGQGQRAAAQADERRQFPRFELVSPLLCHCMGVTHTGEAINASLDGMLILLPVKPPLGMTMAIEFKVQVDQMSLPIRMLGRVLHVANKGRDFQVGIQFEQVMADKKETIRYFMSEVFGVLKFDEGAIRRDFDFGGAPFFRYAFSADGGKALPEKPEAKKKANIR